MKYLKVRFQMKSLKDREIEGYGSTFGNIDLGGDVVMPGAFTKTLAQHRANGSLPKMLWNHDARGLPIGIWTYMEEDTKGLYVRGKFADTALGNDVRTLAIMGGVDAMSIGYKIPMDGADFTSDGTRVLKQVDLWEVSMVNFPMNPRAQIEAAKTNFPSERTYEKYLRVAGMSQKDARRWVKTTYSNGMFGAVGRQWDVDEDDTLDQLERIIASNIRLPE